MVEETKEPVATQNETPPVVEKQPPVEDLVTRASKFKLESNGSEPSQKPEVFFDPKEIEKIQDPQAREYAQKAYIEMNRGLQAKFQEVAQMRKDLEAQRNASWTPERLQAELKKNDFVSSAQYLNSQQTAKNQSGGELTDEQWGVLSPEERAELMQDRQKVNILTQEVNSMRRQQEDARLKSIYANYNPEVVTKLQDDLYNNRYQAGPEDIWKVADYEAMAKRSYELGKQDRQRELGEKAGAISPDGINSTSSYEIPQRQPKESTVSLFKRIALKRMSEMNRVKK